MAARVVVVVAMVEWWTVAYSSCVPPRWGRDDAWWQRE